MIIMTSPAAESAQSAAPQQRPSFSATTATKPTTTKSSPSETAVTSPIMSPTLAPQQQSQQPEPQSVLVRRQFPAVVFTVLYSAPESTPQIRGVYMSLSNANQECRRLKDEISVPKQETPAQMEQRVAAERKRDIGRELERWSDAEGVECWVEVHAVVPRKWMDRGSVSSVTHPPAPKLYQNEEEDDEIVEGDEDEVGGFQ